MRRGGYLLKKKSLLGKEGRKTGREKEEREAPVFLSEERENIMWGKNMGLMNLYTSVFPLWAQENVIGA